MAGVVHGHAEDLPRRRQELAVEGIADPARAVNRGVFRGVEEHREDGLGRGLDGDTRTDRLACHSYYLRSHGLEPIRMSDAARATTTSLRNPYPPATH